MFSTFSPLEQFGIYKIINIKNFYSFDISITNSTLFCLIGFIFFFIITILISSKAFLIPTIWQNILEMFFEFVFFNIVSENIKKSGERYFPILLTVFFFIICCNLLGMIPFSFTVTSHIIITFSIALFIFFGINVIGIKIHGLHLLSLFLPSGAPLIMAPLLVFIEIVSYSFRVVSLSLRLFANMMSGHCLLKILAGFAWTMFGQGGFLTVFHVIPLIVIFAIIGLELGIAFLQAYVFTLLLCVYINDAISLH